MIENFEEFKRQNVTVRLFPPNVTSWKQPCDLGIIGALKKRYKYLYLKDVLTFYTLNEASKNMVLDLSNQLRKGAPGVAHGQPANLFDAAFYITEAWNNVTAKAIQNCFRKAGLKIQFVDQEDDSSPAKEVDVEDLVHLFNEMKVEINHQLIEQFVQIDEETSPEYAEEIAIENQQAIDELERGAIHFHDEENDEMAAGSSQCRFCGYTKLYTEAVETECQLSSEAALGIAPELYHKLKSTHEKYQRLLNKAALSEQGSHRKKTKQLTLFDMMK